jgi:hypothetical protein
MFTGRISKRLVALNDGMCSSVVAIPQLGASLVCIELMQIKTASVQLDRVHLALRL